MIRHVVMWKMNGADAAERAAQAEEGARLLRAMDGVVPQLRAISAGANGLFPGVNWDLVLVADFDSAEDLDAYSVHPEHQIVIAYMKQVVAERAAVDIVL